MIKKRELPQYSRRIVSLRDSRGMSQKVLGSLVGVTAEAITMWETGKRFPRGKNLTKLAEVLNVAPSYILDDSKDIIVADTPPSKSDLILDIQSRLTALNYDQLRLVLQSISALTDGPPAIGGVKTPSTSGAK